MSQPTDPPADDEEPEGTLERLHSMLLNFDGAISSELLTADANTTGDDAINEYVDAARKKQDQTHKFRDSLFTTVQRALVGTLLVAVGIMAAYITSEWGHISPAVMISFHTAVVVNTIGLAYIVANYLFPRGGGD